MAQPDTTFSESNVNRDPSNGRFAKKQAPDPRGDLASERDAPGKIPAGWDLADVTTIDVHVDERGLLIERWNHRSGARWQRSSPVQPWQGLPALAALRSDRPTEKQTEMSPDPDNRARIERWTYSDGTVIERSTDQDQAATREVYHQAGTYDPETMRRPPDGSVI